MPEKQPPPEWPGLHDPEALPWESLRLWDQRGEPADAAENMATDEALLHWCANTGEVVMRWYDWKQPTLSFGYFSALQDVLPEVQPGEQLIRRWTGGGLVHHAHAMTWTLVVPWQHSFCRFRPSASYVFLHQRVADTLNGSGNGPVEVVPESAPVPAGGLCALAPAPGDVISAGRKVAGAGQRRTRQGLLHQGVLFFPPAALSPDFPQILAGSLAKKILAFPSTPGPGWPLPLPLERYQAADWNGRR